MEELIVNIKGITSQHPSTLCENGECSEILNMRSKNGIWQPTAVPLPTYSTQVEGCAVIFIHKNANYKNFISYDNTALYYELQEESNETIDSKTRKKILDISEVKKIESIGNVLVIITENSLHYLLFVDSEYLDLGTKPPFPEIMFSVESTRTKGTMAPEFHFSESIKVSDNMVLKPEIVKDYAKIVNNIYNASQESLLKENYISNPTLIIYALRLYDGSYILPSAPTFLPSSSMPNTCPIKIPCIYDINDNILDFAKTEITAQGAKFQYKILEWDLGNWKSIVSGVDFFISSGKSAVTANIKNNKLTHIGYDFYLIGELEPMPIEDISRDLINENLFYKVGTISNDEHVEKNINKPLIEKVDLEKLVYQEQLKLEYRSHHSFHSQISHTYNNRLHLGNLTTKLFDGYPLSAFATLSENNTGESTELDYIIDATIDVYIKNPQDNLIVRYKSPKEFYMFGLNPILAYPNKDAFKMVITLRAITFHKYYRLELNLKPSPNLDLAYYVQPALKVITFSDFEIVDTPDATIPRNFLRETNKLKVSEVNNPFIFPDKLTYLFSNGEINGLSVVSQSLSQGQLGQFPLYVFTSEGIWTMEKGTENICYSSQLALNRDVALLDKIKAIDTAIVYITSRGIMLLKGTESIPLSSNFDLNSPIEEGFTFYDFLKDAHIGYNYREQEIWLMHSDKPYIYVHNLLSGFWYRRTRFFSNIVNSYPDLHVCDQKGNLYTILQEVSDSETEIICHTRPLKASSMRFNRIRNFQLLFGGEAENIHLTIEGSNDADGQYIPLIKREINQRNYCKLKLFSFKNIQKRFRYFRIHLTAKVRQSFHLDGVRIEVDK